MALSWWQALVLGIVQGMTEWLPVSSSGHLVVAQEVMGVELPLAYDLLLHIATLFVVFLAYRRRWPDIVRGVWSSGPGRRMLIALVVGTLPIVVVGLLLRRPIEAAFDQPRVVGGFLLVTSVLLLSTWRRRGTGTEASPRQALLVGVFQALAVLPGVSRSGATIAGGLHAGLDRRTATDLGFLLAVPALVGATVLQAPGLLGLGSLGAPAIIVGFTASFLSGYLALKAMRALVQRFGLVVFAPYCAVVGVLVLLFL